MTRVNERRQLAKKPHLALALGGLFTVVLCARFFLSDILCFSLRACKFSDMGTAI